MTVAWVTVRLDAPVLDRVAGALWLLPTFTIPKLMLVGVTVSWPGLVSFDGGVDEDVLGALLSPWHPSIEARARRTRVAFQRVRNCFIVTRKTCYPAYTSTFRV